MLAGLVQEAGGLPVVYDIVPDKGEEIHKVLRQALESEAHMVIINAGSSSGSKDYTVHVIKEMGEVLVHGQRAPIVGRVCMDQTMINVSHIPGVRQGDEVVLIGSQGESVITVEEVAERLGTINYEVVSDILARVPRVS